MMQDLGESNPSENRAPGFMAHPNYVMKIAPSTDLHQIIFNETVIAASDRAIVVREQNLRPVVYFPMDDVEMILFALTDEHTHCPFKGVASYWSITTNGKTAENAAWSYPEPYLETTDLKDHIAFYLDKMVCYWLNGIEQPLESPGRCRQAGCDELAA